MTKKTVTIKDAAARYIEHLRKVGKKERTLYTYGADLQLAIDHFGEDKDIAKLIPAQVAGFFKSDAMNKVPKSGREKSIITITKTRRVFRQMLVFCKEQGLVEKVVLTKDEMARVKEAKPEDGEKPARKPRGKKSAAPVDAAPKPKRGKKAKAQAEAPAEPPAEPPADTPADDAE
jgi:hypothetical protein